MRIHAVPDQNFYNDKMLTAVREAGSSRYQGTRLRGAKLWQYGAEIFKGCPNFDSPLPCPPLSPLSRHVMGGEGGSFFQET